MNDADKTWEPKAPKPATAIASHRVHPDKTAQYIEAQKAITDAARSEGRRDLSAPRC